MKYLLAACVMAVLSPLAWSADEPNPFKNAKVGDYAEYKLAITVQGQPIDGKLRMTVTAKDDKEVTTSTVATVMGIDTPAQVSKIDLTKPYDLTGLTNVTGAGTDAKVEKLGEGKEKITVGLKEYDATWTKMKFTAKAAGQDIKGEFKVWTSKDVPLGGIIKMDLKTNLADMLMELTSTGSK